MKMSDGGYLIYDTCFTIVPKSSTVTYVYMCTPFSAHTVFMYLYSHS